MKRKIVNNISGFRFQVSSHTPVLLKEAIQFLDIHSGDFIIDGTIDGGGHGEEILKNLGPKGKLLGIDWDGDILSRCKERLGRYKNIILVQGNYADLPEILRRKKLVKADGLLLDLGFSSEQLELSGKGFSFTRDEPLFMTYDEGSIPVKKILKELDVKDLAKIIFNLSGEKFAMRIAKAIKERGRKKEIETTKDLREIIISTLPANYERGRIDPATRTFQALRMYVNDELGNLKKVIVSLPEILTSGGRVAVISFHSAEDKIVKNSFRDSAKAGMVKILTKKPVVAGDDEVASNPRSRSAKLRAAVVISN